MKKLFSLIIVILSLFIFSNNIYAYKEYNVGDTVKYNDIDFYVIKDSSSEEDVVILLKAEPLTTEEVERYGEGHVNMYVKPYTGYETFLPSSARDQNGYGGMAYYASENCYLYNDSICKNNYTLSEIKYVVDGWASDKLQEVLKEARLITRDEYISLNDVETYETPTEPGIRYIPRYDWMFDEKYWYWTMSNYEDSNNYNWVVNNGGSLMSFSIIANEGTVRPVVEIYKCVIDDSCVSEENKDQISDEVTKDSISVPNTLKVISGLIMLIGMVFVCIGVNIFIIVKNKSRKKD